MTIPAISTVYTDEESIRRHLGELGLDQQVDDIDALSQEGVIDEYIQSESETINFYCHRFYAPAKLVTSRKVWEWCVVLVIYRIMTRQAATPPIIVQKAYMEVKAEMKMVADGWPLPNLARTNVSAPIVHTHESNPYALRKTSPVNSTHSLDESGSMEPTPWILDRFVPFDWE